MPLHLQSSGERRNGASEMLSLPASLETAEGFLVAAVFKVISDPCQ